MTATVSVINAGENAILKATDGTHTYTGGADSTGSGVINVLHSGSYTISSNVKGQTKSLTINSDGTYTIDFQLIVYSAGDQYSAVTGGWTKRNYSVNGTTSAGDFNLETSRISMRGSSSTAQRSTGGGTVNAIDVSGYTTLCVTYSTSSASGDNRMHIALMPAGELDTANALAETGELTLGTSSKTAKVQITPVTASAQIAAIAHRKSNTSVYFYVTKIWLE